jgi:hypothetical protein
MDSKDFFKILKSKKQAMTNAKLDLFYDNCIDMLKKFQITGQTDGMKKVVFLAEHVTKEKQLLDLGITQYVHKYDIDDYIRDISDEDVSIIELSKYERVIPDNIIEKITKCKDIFDEMYVLFTDYTSQHKRKIEADKINNDPILFGCFKRGRGFHDRFYVIGDWIDDYCDLTMEKFLTDFKKHGRDVDNHIYTPEDLNEFKELLNKAKLNGSSIILNGDIGTIES